MPKSQHEIDTEWEKKATKAAWQQVMRWAIIAEAKASVRLDKDPSGHTCHDECTEYPQCPGNNK